MRRVCLVGAGYIAAVHAEALRMVRGTQLAAVVDPNAAAAARLADAWRIEHRYASAEEALAAGGIDAAHVLVPPDLHEPVARPFLAAGIPVLVEKPLAASAAGSAALADAARAGGATLGVNQNFLFHPAFARLRALVGRGAYGRPRFVECIYNVPLRQLAARQFGHWMFASPGNILLEQAVHPLSQIAALAGSFRDMRALAEPAAEIAPGVSFHRAASVLIEGDRLPATMRFAVGQSFPFWRLSVVCDDGVIVADILANRVFAHGRTRWLDAVDGAVAGLRSGAAVAGAGLRNALDYSLSMVRLKPRSDPFFQSMRDSIAAFHAALDAGTAPESDAAFGTALVEACERIRDLCFVPAPAGTATGRHASPAADRDARTADVAVLGGTGFIGTHLVRALLDTGMTVAVMARSVRNLPAVFADPRVQVHRGDIADAEAVRRAIGASPSVVNLAHGGGGGSYAQIRAAMAGGAETVARAAMAAGVRRLVHVGSIASLYLGPQDAPVTGATPPDPQAEERADYARAKAECDRMLLALHAAEGLPVVILRPGLVVGEGSSPFHSGLGFFNNDQHCIGWNDGRNPLPFVLVQDVAAAIIGALRADGIEGRCYNIVGDVRPTARDYIAQLGRALGRPLRFHPKSPTSLWSAELGKWLVKRAGGRAVPLPSRRDILSRGLAAHIDTRDAQRDLGWRPVGDPVRFAALAIDVHRD